LPFAITQLGLGPTLSPPPCILRREPGDRASLIPRPFPPPVFDHWLDANKEGEGLGDLVKCGDIIQAEVYPQGAVSDLIIIRASCQTVSGTVNDEQY